MTRRHAALLVAPPRSRSPRPRRRRSTSPSRTPADYGNGSLRKAIEDANLTAALGPDRLRDPRRRACTRSRPASQFATLTQPVVVDATTQPGYAGHAAHRAQRVKPCRATRTVSVVTTTGATVRGFAINRLPGRLGHPRASARPATATRSPRIASAPTRAGPRGSRTTTGSHCERRRRQHDRRQRHFRQRPRRSSHQRHERRQHRSRTTDRHRRRPGPSRWERHRRRDIAASFPNVVGPGNVIAANGQDGVRIGDNAHGSRVRGSRIGIGSVARRSATAATASTSRTATAA